VAIGETFPVCAGSYTRPYTHVKPLSGVIVAIVSPPKRSSRGCISSHTASGCSSSSHTRCTRAD
jgi:hypothetical protein